jgi:hypothetical protein
MAESAITLDLTNRLFHSHGDATEMAGERLDHARNIRVVDEHVGAGIADNPHARLPSIERFGRCDDDQAMPVLLHDSGLAFSCSHLS